MRHMSLRVVGVGKVTRSNRNRITKALRASYLGMGHDYHKHHMPLRFTKAHARKAKYKPRKGQLQNPNSKAFKRSYTYRKWKQFGHTRPLEYSGLTKKLVRTGVRFIVTSGISSGGKEGGVKTAYSGARGLNRKHPNSDINMVEEFTTVLPEEVREFGRTYDKRLGRELANSG